MHNFFHFDSHNFYECRFAIQVKIKHVFSKVFSICYSNFLYNRVLTIWLHALATTLAPFDSTHTPPYSTKKSTRIEYIFHHQNTMPNFINKNRMLHIFMTFSKDFLVLCWFYCNFKFPWITQRILQKVF